MKLIKEILDRMQQGFTEATLCRAEDGHTYVVKARKRAGSNALISEWIAGRIGGALGLPIPSMEILTFDHNLARYILHPDAEALAESPSFGSRLVESVLEFSPQLNAQVDARLKAKILLFDWWVHNEDRSDHNSNLLWQANERRLHVIDHNMAFDNDFDTSRFWENHLFRENRPLWDVIRAQISPELQRIIARLPDYWRELPSEWTDTGGATTMDRLLDVLKRAEAPNFWTSP
jgi:hypothetical protein